MAYLDTVKTAQQVIEGADGGQDAKVNALEEEHAELARDAGVTQTAYVGYAAALTNYESRDDVEPLAERRAREAAAAFADQDFRRAGTGSIALITSPADGNVGTGAAFGTDTYDDVDPVEPPVTP